jgi:hypothetical protein
MQNSNEKNITNSSTDVESTIIFVFWIKIILGIAFGVISYFILRLMQLFSHFFLVALIFFFIAYFITIGILYRLKKENFKSSTVEKSIWKICFDYSVLYIVVFIISSGVTFFIGI